MKKFNIKKVLFRVAVIAGIGFVAFSFYTKSKPKNASQEVMTSQVVIGNVESLITGSGTLSPAEQYEVKSLVKGAILKAPFTEGDTVKKGELLYQISTREIANTIKSAELGVEKAKQSYKDYLIKKAAQQVTSKASGYIKRLYVKEGDNLQPGKVIADIYNGDALYLDVLFPSGEVKKSWIGKTASIIMDATEEVIKAKVTDVSSMEEVMDGGILSKKVTILVKNEGGLKAGDTAEASVEDVTSNNIGTFRGETEISISVDTDGKIDRLLFKEGQWINMGEQILSLSSMDLESQIKLAKLGITEAELALKTQKEQEKLYTISSPISGQIITKSKKQGDTIDPGTDTQAGPMAIIYDMSFLTFQMNIDELQISSIKKGQKVGITTQALPGTSFTGVIDRISLKGNTNNGVTSYPVIVKVDKAGKLLPGMNVMGKIIIDKADNVLIVPSSALQQNNVIYVQSDATQKGNPTIPKGFKEVEVEIGINDGANVEIKKGLKEGDSVYIPFDATVEMQADFYYEE
jgi:HlyD family secretion protein